MCVCMCVSICTNRKLCVSSNYRRTLYIAIEKPYGSFQDEVLDMFLSLSLILPRQLENVYSSSISKGRGILNMHCQKHMCLT